MPGPGIGGHCIPIDPYYLSWKAKKKGANANLMTLMSLKIKTIATQERFISGDVNLSKDKIEKYKSNQLKIKKNK